MLFQAAEGWDGKGSGMDLMRWDLNGWDGIASAIRSNSMRLDGTVFWMGWDRCGMDLVGWDLIASAMRCEALRCSTMQRHAMPHHGIRWNLMGWDPMLCVAIPWDWISTTMDGVDQLWLVACRSLTMARCSAARSSVFNDGTVIRCSLVGFIR